MALVSPRPFPAGLFGQMQFGFRRNDVSTPDATNSADGLQMGYGYWEMVCEFVARHDAEQARRQAFIESLRGQAVPFIASDIRVPCPISLMTDPMTGADPFAGLTRGTGGSFVSGVATGWSVDGTRSQLTLTGLPALFAMTDGDFVGLWWASGAKLHLVRSLENVTANGTGTVTFEVNPPVWPLVPGGAFATLKQPGCLMKLVSREPQPSEVDGSWRERITARQYLVA